MSTLKPGIYPGLSYREYDAIDAVRASLLKMFDRTPAHARYEMLHPKGDTAALRMGDALHAAILEPRRFEAEYACKPGCDRRTNAGKAASAQWDAAHPGTVALLEDEWAAVTAMRDAVLAHPTAAALVRGQGRNELVIVWEDAETGLMCKARVDRITDYHGFTVVPDLKTCRDASPKAFSKVIAEYGYHMQAAFYLNGLATVAPLKQGVRRFVFLCVENTPPHCVACYEPEDSVIEEGRRQYRAKLDAYARGKKEGIWPGYMNGLVPLDIPKWAYREEA